MLTCMIKINEWWLLKQESLTVAKEEHDLLLLMSTTSGLTTASSWTLHSTDFFLANNKNRKLYSHEVLSTHLKWMSWISIIIMTLLTLLFLGVFRQMLGNKWLNEMIKEACQVSVNSINWIKETLLPALDPQSLIFPCKTSGNILNLTKLI